MLKFGNHHAYFIEGEKDFVLKEIENFLEKQNFETQANPDYLVLEYENLSVEDARNLRIMHIGAAVGEGKRVSVIYFSGATVEAQNALLKMFEEPNPTSRFFIIAPSLNILLPTLKSRFEILRVYAGENLSQIDVSPEKFLEMNFSQKNQAIKKILEKYTKDKITKSEIFKFLRNLSEILKVKVIKKEEKKEKLTTLLKTLSYVNDRSSSLKMLLENLVIGL